MACGQLGHQQVRDHRGEPRARTEHDPVRLQHGLDRLRAGRRIARDQVHRPHLGGRLGHLRPDRGSWRSRPGSADPGRSPRPRSPAARRPSAAPGPPRPSSRATMSSPATGSPSRSHRPRSAGCRWRGRPAARRRGSGTAARRPRSGPTRRHHTARPGPSAGHPAAGSCSSARSRPEEPPSSATVTMAVSRSVIRRSALSEAASPWPPPNATTAGSRARDGSPGAGRPPAHHGSLPSHVAVQHLGRHAELAQPPPELLGDRRAAVLAAGAADGDRDEALALLDVARRPSPAADPAAAAGTPRRRPGPARSRGPACSVRSAVAAPAPSAGWAGTGRRPPGRRRPGCRS